MHGVCFRAQVPGIAGIPLRVAIVGSRKFNDASHHEACTCTSCSTRLKAFKGFVEKYVSRLPNGTEVVSGGASGVDSWAFQEATRRKGIKVTVFRPDYNRYPGKVAPLKRNDEIVAYTDILVAFWNGRSKGTEYTLRKAEAAHVPHAIVLPASKPDEFIYRSEETPVNMLFERLPGH